MIIKHSQIRNVVKFIGITIFLISMYKKLKQLFVHGGVIVPQRDDEPEEEGELLSKYHSPIALAHVPEYLEQNKMPYEGQKVINNE